MLNVYDDDDQFNLKQSVDEYPESHWHIGTTCCGGILEYCIHDIGLQLDLEKEDDDLSNKSTTRVVEGLMEIEAYECTEDSRNKESAPGGYLKGRYTCNGFNSFRTCLSKTTPSQVPQVFLDAFEE